MKRGPVIFIFLLTGWLNSSIAQSPIFKSFTIQDGLTGNPVRKIFQDSKGFIWICTWGGLSKYDGHHFTSFSTANGLSHDLVNDICETADGKLYVALNNGITQQIVNDRILPRTATQNITVERFVHINKGEMLALTSQDGIMKLADNDKLQPMSPSIDLSDGSMLKIADSLFLVSSPDLNKLYLFNSKFEPVGIYKDHVSAYTLFQDSHNRILAGCHDGLKEILIDGKKRSIRLTLADAIFKHPFLLKERINCIWEDNHNDFWIGTNAGLVFLEKSGAIQKFTKADGLPDEHIYCFFEDREKNIWVGTGQGVARFANQGRTKYWSTRNGLLRDYVAGLAKSRNEYFICEGNNIQKIIPEFNQINNLDIRLSPGYNLYSVPITALTYIYTTSYTPNGSIRKIDLNNNVIKDIINYVLPSGRQFYCLAIKNESTFVIGTTEGLTTIYKGQVQLDSTISGLITCLFVHDSILWVGTHSKGLYRFRLEEKENLKLSDQTRIFNLPDSMIRSIYKDSKGILWVGTRFNGVYRIIEEKDRSYRVEQIDKSRGLISNWVRFITEDKNHNIWIGSNSGVDKLLESENEWRVFNFSRFNNLFGVVNTILPDDNGSVWIGMNNGLAKISESGYDALPPMPVYITTIETHLEADSSFVPTEYRSLSLPYFNNAISFNFTSPSFINEKEMKYSFRLMSHRDTVWSTPSHRNSVSYASLEPGTYRFEVKNLGWNGVWGIPTSYSFTVRPPFWKTWWFILLLSSLILGVFYLFYRYRINQLRRIQLVRNRIANDLHDDIGSALTNISILTELSKRNKYEPEKAEIYIDRIREEIDSSGQALDDIIWSVNTRNDTLHETATRMRRYASELFDAGNIRYDLTMDAHIADKKIEMEQRRDLFLIFKEILNNIHKHAAAKSVKISLFVEKEILKLVISDDGIGFDPIRLTNRNGISNIKNRVSRWKGNIDFQSKNGIGTTIKIWLPLSGIAQKGE